jgi:hypothetical protein
MLYKHRSACGTVRAYASFYVLYTMRAAANRSDNKAIQTQHKTRHMYTKVTLRLWVICIYLLRN